MTQNINAVHEQQRTIGDKIASTITHTIGSWGFVIGQSAVLGCWILLNAMQATGQLHIDPYPFVFLNFLLSFQAAYAAPFIMMSQNRQSAKDHLTAEQTYHTTLKNEKELSFIIEFLQAHEYMLDQQQQLTEEILSIVQKRRVTAHRRSARTQELSSSSPESEQTHE
jgi:uncharacterized membrane protein